MKHWTFEVYTQDVRKNVDMIYDMSVWFDMTCCYVVLWYIMWYNTKNKIHASIVYKSGYCIDSIRREGERDTYTWLHVYLSGWASSWEAWRTSFSGCMYLRVASNSKLNLCFAVGNLQQLPKHFVLTCHEKNCYDLQLSIIWYCLICCIFAMCL